MNANEREYSKIGSRGKRCREREREFRWSDFRLLVLTNSPADGFAERFADAVDGDAVKDLLEEAGDDHTCGLFARQAAALSVEEHFVVHAAGRGTVRAADIVR